MSIRTEYDNPEKYYKEELTGCTIYVDKVLEKHFDLVTCAIYKGTKYVGTFNINFIKNLRMLDKEDVLYMRLKYDR